METTTMNKPKIKCKRCDGIGYGAELIPHNQCRECDGEGYFHQSFEVILEYMVERWTNKQIKVFVENEQLLISGNGSFISMPVSNIKKVMFQPYVCYTIYCQANVTIIWTEVNEILQTNFKS